MTVLSDALRRMRPTAVGSFDGMDYTRWGEGSRTVLWIPGGPGSSAPRGGSAALAGLQFLDLVDAGWQVYLVARRRHMPHGYTVADMAGDYARVISEHLGGAVDVVVGVSYGGFIVQHLAASYPQCCQRAVIAMAAARGTVWGDHVDSRFARARAAGDRGAAGRAMAEYVFPRAGQRLWRNALGAVFAETLRGDDVPPGDLLVEADAEHGFDARDVLSGIEVPVLLIHAGEDLFFTEEMARETAAAIPDCRFVQYEGMGHMRASASPRLVRDILAFAE